MKANYDSFFKTDILKSIWCTSYRKLHMMEVFNLCVRIWFRSFSFWTLPLLLFLISCSKTENILTSWGCFAAAGVWYSSIIIYIIVRPPTDRIKDDLSISEVLLQVFFTFSWISCVDWASQKATVATSFSMGISTVQSRPSSSATRGRGCMGPFMMGGLMPTNKQKMRKKSCQVCRTKHRRKVFIVRGGEEFYSSAPFSCCCDERPTQLQSPSEKSEMLFWKKG